MMRLRFSLTVFQILQLHCATVLLWAAPRWHTQYCSPTLQDLPLWAVMGFAIWRVASGFRLAPRRYEGPVAPARALLQSAV